MVSNNIGSSSSITEILIWGSRKRKSLVIIILEKFTDIGTPKKWIFQLFQPFNQFYSIYLLSLVDLVWMEVTVAGD